MTAEKYIIVDSTHIVKLFEFHHHTKPSSSPHIGLDSSSCEGNQVHSGKNHAHVDRSRDGTEDEETQAGKVEDGEE